MSGPVGIIGNGMVGSQLAAWFEGQARVYDTNVERCRHTLAAVLECDTIFLAPYLEDNAILDGFGVLSDYLRIMRPGTVAVIKSTVFPGTCDELQRIHPHVIVLFNPEFLTERTAAQDFLNPDLQVVGGPAEYAKALLDRLPIARCNFTATRRQAEWLKLSMAAYLASKVSWFNQLLDTLGEENFRAVREMMAADPRVGKTHTDPGQDGYRGWAGKCFSKDVPCFWDATLSSEAQAPMWLVEEVIRYNRELLMIHEGEAQP